MLVWVLLRHIPAPIYTDFWEYDIKNDTWKQVASFPGKASNDLFSAVIDDCYIYHRRLYKHAI